MSADFPSQADTVVIGAGAVGCSVAYHLSELGAEDVVVVDQGPLPVTGGSSVHAPGIMFQTSPSKIQTKAAYYTSRLLSDAGVYDEVGGIELARSEERMDFLRRRVEWAESYGLPDPQLLSPEEVTEHFPLVDEDEILGGYYSPTDGRVDGISALQWYIAKSDGADFYGNVEVTDLDVAGDSIGAVETDRGTIDCDRCVIATNNWGYQTAQMADLDLPIAPVEHQYVVTEALEELSGVDSNVGSNTEGLQVPGNGDIQEYMSEGPHRPVGRDQDNSLYFRTHGDSLGLGSYNHEALSVDPDVMGKNSEESQASVHSFTSEHWEKATHPDREKSPKQAFDELLPATKDVEYEATENGIFVFTPDGMPAIGPTHVDGLWSALAIWWTHSGGYGKIIAEWMENGVPRLPSGPVDTGGVHVRRFSPHAGEKNYFVDKGATRYRQVYSIVEPRWQPDKHRGLRRSPFYDRQQDLGAEFYQSGGWESAQWYDSNADLVEEYEAQIPDQDGWQSINRSKIEAAEHLHTRDAVSMFDMTSFSSIMVEGADAGDFLQRVCSNDVDIDVGDVRYSLLLNEGGGILADVTVVRLGAEEYMVTTGGGNSPGIHGGWLEDHAPETVSVTVEEGAKSTIGLWGPKSRLLLQRCTDADVSNDDFPYFSAKQIYVGEVPVIALRVSYVGELGWELWAPTEYGNRLWETLYEAGQDLDVRPMGGGALESMRLEKGYRLWGTDIDTDSNPYEAGLGFAVDLDTDFIGKEALEAAKAEGVDAEITPITLDDSTDILLSGRPVLVDGEAQGYVQAADFGYTIGESIAYTYLPTEYTEAGTDVQVRCEGELYDATVRNEPLFDPGREKIIR